MQDFAAEIMNLEGMYSNHDYFQISSLNDNSMKRSVACQTIGEYELNEIKYRPKRSLVKIACIHCKKACKKCDDSRPCGRCVRSGNSESCVDAPRKKRKGRSSPISSYCTPKAENKYQKITINGNLFI